MNGDPERLQQVISNLLNNAVKFTPAGGTVRVSLAAAPPFAEITVTDSGVGITADVLPHVFDRFRQADSSSTRRHGGLGLGLAIVRSLVEQHDGTVEVSSDGAGRGATFVVRLPLAARSAPLGDDPRSLELGDLSGLTVLLVEDDADTREALVDLLQVAGANMLSAESARAAWVLLEHERPDVILSDIGMPEEDGHAFLRRVRARPTSEGGKVPAVALTAFACAEDRTRALRSGFTAHVTKPVDPAELITTIQSVCGRVLPS